MHWVEEISLRESGVPLRKRNVAATVEHEVRGERLRVDDWSKWAHDRNEQLLLVLGIRHHQRVRYSLHQVLHELVPIVADVHVCMIDGVPIARNATGHNSAVFSAQQTRMQNKGPTYSFPSRGVKRSLSLGSSMIFS